MNGKEFLTANVLPNKIVFATKVPIYLPKTAHTHTNRQNHGFAFHREGPKTYHFWDFKDIDIDVDTVIYMPKGSNYNVTSNIKEAKSCYAINFDVADDFFCDPFVYKPKDPAKVLGLFKEAERAWRTKYPGYIEKCAACLSEIICIMKNDLTVKYLSSSQKSLISPALEYIAENYTSKKINIKELAAMCSISEVYLRKLFASEIGKTPVAYINHLRLERSCELLRSGEYTVAGAAKECGFSDECYFNREFKKHYGFPPGNIKNN